MSEKDHSNNLKSMLIGCGVLTVVILIGLHLWFGPRWYQGYQPSQEKYAYNPNSEADTGLPFSHKLHAGQYEIPCMYCHGSAEQASFAAVPGLQVCMNCHSQVATDKPNIIKLTEMYNNNQPVPWVKVHVLPDFVHFNHRAHVAAGVDCETCHGPVQEMEVVYQYARLTMGWCMDCHRNDDYLTEQRVSLLTKQQEMMGGPRGERLVKAFTGVDYVSADIANITDWVFELIGGHPEIHNANVSCSTCHY